MNITVTKNQVSVDTDYILNDKEYNVNQCYFTFSDEYTDDLVKKAIFVQGTSTIEMSIINNQCQIPAEVLNNGQFELRVYAYEVDGEELLLRYSPSYTTAYVRTGSYIENAESPEVITPTQFEQYMQAMNDGLNEVANVDIDAEQTSTGGTVTITNRYGEEKTVEIKDGEKGETGATPNIQIGTVVTGDHSEVTRTGTNENPIFNFVLEKGDKGDTGNGIASVTKTSTSGLVDTYTITYTNGTTTTFNVTNGKSITNIAKTSTSGLEDTYTITYNDNTTSTFTVENGNGISSIEKTGTQDNVDTYTIYYTNGTTSTFTVTNSTVTNQEFEELKTEHEELVNTLPRVEGTGESITLDNTAQYKMNVALSGNTSQTTYTGKNLFNKDTVTFINGILDNEGNPGTSTASHYTDNYYAVLPNTQYTLSGTINTSTSANNIYYYNNSKNWISKDTASTNSPRTFTTPNDCYYIRIQVSTGISLVAGNVQLEIGSSATSYEPFVGGYPSPSPLYPQPIKKVTGNNSITVCGKNIFNINNPYSNSGVSSSVNNNQLTVTKTTTTSANCYTAYRIYNIINNTTYNFSYTAVADNIGAYSIRGYKKDGTYVNIKSSTQSLNVDTTITIPNDIYYLTIFFYASIAGNAGSLNDKTIYSNIQLEHNTIKTSYEPYQSQTYPINLGSLEYCKIGNYSDEFYLDNGNWYIRRNIGKVVLDGTEPYNALGGTTSNPYYVFYNNNSQLSNSIKSTIIYSNYFIVDNSSGLLQKDGGCRIAEFNSINRAFFCIHSITNVNDFKTWLTTHNTTVYYILATTTSEAITDTTLINQLNNLYNQIKSYKGQTNITQSNAELPFNIEASALYDLNNLISRVATLEVEV